MKDIIASILAFSLSISVISTIHAQGKDIFEQNSDSTQVIRTKVKGITCSTDLKMISANVEKLQGVNSCKAGKTGPTTTFEIAFDPKSVTEEDIHTAIQNTGSCDDPDKRPYKVKQTTGP